MSGAAGLQRMHVVSSKARRSLLAGRCCMQKKNLCSGGQEPSRRSFRPAAELLAGVSCRMHAPAAPTLRVAIFFHDFFQ